MSIGARGNFGEEKGEPVMHGGKYLRLVGVILGMGGGVGEAGPYSGGSNDGGNGYDAGVPGFVGPAGVGGAVLDDG